jgi:hypothetical protein
MFKYSNSFYKTRLNLNCNGFLASNTCDWPTAKVVAVASWVVLHGMNRKGRWREQGGRKDVDFNRFESC